MEWVYFRGVIGFNIVHNLKLQVNAQIFLYKKAKSQLCSNDVVFLSLMAMPKMFHSHSNNN